MNLESAYFFTIESLLATHASGISRGQQRVKGDYIVDFGRPNIFRDLIACVLRVNLNDSMSISILMRRKIERYSFLP